MPIHGGRLAGAATLQAGLMPFRRGTIHPTSFNPELIINSEGRLPMTLCPTAISGGYMVTTLPKAFEEHRNSLVDASANEPKFYRDYYM